VLVAIAMAVGVWDQFIKYRFVAKRFGTVVPGRIYRSGQISKWMIGPTIEDHGIEVIVDLTSLDPRDEHQQVELETAERMGVEHRRLVMSGDGIGATEDYATAVEILHDCAQDGRPVLVHCAAGAQRTGGVVASYRLLVEGKSPAEAMAEMQSYGWRGDTDAKLLAFLDGQMQELAELLVERGVIDKVPDPLPLFGAQ
jgi:protein tyrosine/serine phosphatase